MKRKPMHAAPLPGLFISSFLQVPAQFKFLSWIPPVVDYDEDICMLAATLTAQHTHCDTCFLSAFIPGFTQNTEKRHPPCCFLSSFLWAHDCTYPRIQQYSSLPVPSARILCPESPKLLDPLHK